MSIDVNFATYNSKLYVPSRGDVTPISVMNEMNNIMEYMVSFNPFLVDLQAKYNGLESKKNELWKLQSSMSDPAMKDKPKEEADAIVARIEELTAEIKQICSDCDDALQKHSDAMNRAIINGISHAYTPYMSIDAKCIVENIVRNYHSAIGFVLDSYMRHGIRLPGISMNHYFFMNVVNQEAENIAIANGYRYTTIMISEGDVESLEGIKFELFGFQHRLSIDSIGGYVLERVDSDGSTDIDLIVLEKLPDWKHIHVKDVLTFNYRHNKELFEAYIFVMANTTERYASS